MTDVKEYLPVGSVIMLKGGKKKLMVFGIKQMSQEESGKEYDYIGVLYPEGNMGVKYQYVFNHENIEAVYFKGYENEERDEFIGKLDEIIKKQNQS